VHTTWEKSKSGPERCSYALTRAGPEELHRHARSLAATGFMLHAFLGRYEEFVALGDALRPDPASARRECER